MNTLKRTDRRAHNVHLNAIDYLNGKIFKKP